MWLDFLDCSPSRNKLVCVCVCVCAWVIWEVRVYVCVRVWTFAVCVRVCAYVLLLWSIGSRLQRCIEHLVSVGVAGCTQQDVGEQARAEATAGH